RRSRALSSRPSHLASCRGSQSPALSPGSASPQSPTPPGHTRSASSLSSPSSSSHFPRLSRPTCWPPPSRTPMQRRRTPVEWFCYSGSQALALVEPPEPGSWSSFGQVAAKALNAPRRFAARFRVDLLEQVGRRQARSRRRESCPRAAERGLEIDTLNESLWRLAMQAESKLRLRQAVAERYERVRALLGVLGGRATA